MQLDVIVVREPITPVGGLEGFWFLSMITSGLNKPRARELFGSEGRFRGEERLILPDGAIKGLCE